MMKTTCPFHTALISKTFQFLILISVKVSWSLVGRRVCDAASEDLGQLDFLFILVVWNVKKGRRVDERRDDIR